ncbi:RNA polymerase sigma factor [Schlesneria paludicola]|uniref:RNA polymerase sigma factor n=1 Tax=Schlesneria paludicola TaxID=360056 RepID=UPI00029AB908|nr:sigma-70 family RNA polymerase sigma factor [Schlesneria paludicola]
MTTWFSGAKLAQLLDEHFAALSLFASQWTDSAEDCVQEAVLELARQTTPPENIVAWLFHVVRRRAMTTHRSMSRRRRHEAMAARLARVSNERHENAVDVEELLIALGELGDDEREVIVARIWGGLGYAEVALSLEISTATAFRRFESGLKNLKAVLEARCNNTNHSNCRTT